MRTHAHIHTTPHHTKTELNCVQILFANTRQVKDEKCKQPPRNPGAQSFSPLREPWIFSQGWRQPLFCTQVLFWGAGWCHYQILWRPVAPAEPLRVRYCRCHCVTALCLLLIENNFSAQRSKLDNQTITWQKSVYEVIGERERERERREREREREVKLQKAHRFFLSTASETASGH